MKTFPSVYKQSAQYRSVERRYAWSSQTRTPIQLRLQFCLVQVTKTCTLQCCAK